MGGREAKSGLAIKESGGLEVIKDTGHTGLNPNHEGLEGGVQVCDCPEWYGASQCDALCFLFETSAYQWQIYSKVFKNFNLC